MRRKFLNRVNKSLFTARTPMKITHIISLIQYIEYKNRTWNATKHIAYRIMNTEYAILLSVFRMEIAHTT